MVVGRGGIGSYPICCVINKNHELSLNTVSMSLYMSLPVSELSRTQSDARPCSLTYEAQYRRIGVRLSAVSCLIRIYLVNVSALQNSLFCDSDEQLQSCLARYVENHANLKRGECMSPVFRT